MIYTDHHVHTRFSPDSQADIHAYLKAGKRLGLEFVMFTDHVDFGTTDPEFMEPIDYRGYFEEMKRLEEAYEIPIQVGVEIGYEKHHKGQIEEFLGQYPFHFVIASIHYGDGKDFYLGDFFHGKDQRGSYKRYFEILQEMAENFSAYDVAGHIDYITRYGPFLNKHYEFTEFEPSIDPILQALIHQGKGIELNTSGLRGKGGSPFPKPEVLGKYRALGGKIITVGSDAHFNEHYQAGIKEGIGQLKDLGYTEISSFTKRQEKKLPL